MSPYRESARPRERREFRAFVFTLDLAFGFLITLPVVCSMYGASWDSGNFLLSGALPAFAVIAILETRRNHMLMLEDTER